MSAPTPLSCTPRPAQIFLRFGLAQVNQFTFDLRADHHGFGREMLAARIPEPLATCWRGADSVRIALATDRGEVRFRYVAGEQSRLSK